MISKYNTAPPYNEEVKKLELVHFYLGTHIGCPNLKSSYFSFWNPLFWHLDEQCITSFRSFVVPLYKRKINKHRCAHAQLTIS